MKKIKTVFNLVQNEDEPARLNLYGFIGQTFWNEDEQSITAKAVAKALSEIDSDEVDVHINSYGGIAFEGIGIYNQLKQSNKKINIYIDAIAASAASVIAMAGDTIFMPENAQIMVHHAATDVYGNVEELTKAIQGLNAMDESMIKTYETRFVGTEEELIKLMNDETYLNAEEAITLGFADEIVDLAADDAEDSTEENVKQSLFAKYSGNQMVARKNSRITLAQITSNGIQYEEKVPIEDNHETTAESMASKFAKFIAEEGN